MSRVGIWVRAYRVRLVGDRDDRRPWLVEGRELDGPGWVPILRCASDFVARAYVGEVSERQAAMQRA